MLIHLLQSRRYSRALALALIGAMTTGCYTTTLIPPNQASRLAVDALSLPGELRAVRNVDGEMVVIGESFTAQIEVVPGLAGGWAQWSERRAVVHSPFTVDVRGSNLVFSPPRQPEVEAPLDYVKQIRVSEFSTGNTVGCVLGLMAGAALLGVGVAAASLGRMQ
ncbi:MAG: hypothetical protein ABJE95_12470 [Byssovorax sp.]